MAKQSEKVAADKQPESQRGKSRFAVQPRPNRAVLPERPPREIDNEIVSILLGGDPASLTTQIPEEPASFIEEALSNPRTESTPPVQYLQREENPAVSKEAVPSREVNALSTSLEPPENTATDSPAETSVILKPALASTPAKVKRASAVPTRGISGQDTSLPRSDGGKRSITIAENNPSQEQTISTFDEFAERWRHGLRKGQLKVCEVLYQKTYALGEIECVTSFSELGRLSGLKMRQCFNVIAQLEALKFVERAKSETTSNKKDQGSIIRFFLFPKN
jgi:hypothetical protein